MIRIFLGLITPFVLIAGITRADVPATQPATFPYTPVTPLAELTETKIDPLYTRERLMITGQNGEQIPILLTLPTAGQAPFPVALLIHGAYDDRKENLIYAMAGRLAKKGIAAASIDLPGHGQRATKDHQAFRKALGIILVAHTKGNPLAAQILRVDPNALMPENLLKSGEAVAAGWADCVTDARRVIDYLQTRKELNTSKLGVIGQSMGGDVGVWLTADEPRIKVLATGISGAFDTTPPETVPFRKFFGAAALQDYTKRISPRPVLMIASKTDPIVGVADYQRLYDAFVEPKQIEWIATGHNITRPGFDFIATWIAKQLDVPAPTTQP